MAASSTSELKSASSELISAYDKLVHPNIKKLALVGIPGVGKTWMARMISNRTVKEKTFDFAIWVHATKKINKETPHKVMIEELRDVMIRELSLDIESNDKGATMKQNEALLEKETNEPLPEEKNNVTLPEEKKIGETLLERKNRENHEKEMKIRETLDHKKKKKLRETLEGKKILFVVDNEENASRVVGALKELIANYKDSPARFLITSTVKDTGCEETIEVGPLSEDDCLSWIREVVKRSDDEIKEINEVVKGSDEEIDEVARSFIEKCERLPTDMLIFEKIFKELKKNRSGLPWWKIAKEQLQDVGGQGSKVIEMLYKGDYLKPRNLLVDLCLYANAFLHRESLHFNEVIAYWMLEGSLGPFDRIEYAYEKGHDTLMELLNCGLIKELEDGYVVANKCYIAQKEADSFLCPTDRCDFILGTHLGLRTVFSDAFGKIVESNGMMKTIRNEKEEKPISALLLDANRINRGIEIDLHQSNEELEIFALFDPTCELLPPYLFQMHKLRLLVLRRCTYLKSIATKASDADSKTPATKASDADSKTDIPQAIPTTKSSLQWLTVLEISGPSLVEIIPNDLFTSMPSLRSINLSHLKIKELPDSFYDLKEVVCLILEGCSSLEELKSLVKFTKLQVLNLSGAESFKRFHDRNFEKNPELEAVNLNKCLMKSLPILHHLINLKYLLLKGCTKLRRLPKISALTKLEVLDLSGAESFEVFHESSLGELKKLKVIKLSKTAIKKLPLIFGNPDHLCLKGCTQLKRFSFVEAMKKLRVLDLSDCINLVEINETFFSNLIGLRELNCSGTKVETLPSLSCLTSLHRLSLSGCHSLNKLEGLNELSNLVELNISRSIPLNELESLGQMSNTSLLAKLDISFTKINKLPSLSNLVNLKELVLQNCTELVKLPSLEALSKLEVLNLSGCNKLDDMGGDESFGKMSALRILDLSDTSLKQLPSMSKLEKLKYLSLRNCNNLEDPKFGNHQELEELDLSGSAVTRLPTASFPNLLSLNLQNCPKLDKFHDGVDKIFPPRKDQFPYEILSLPHLKLLVLPLLKKNQEESTGGQWQLSYWPNLSEDNTLQVSMSSAQFHWIFGKNGLLRSDLDKYSSALHPVGVKTRYGNGHLENEVVPGDSYTQKLVQDVKRLTPLEKSGSLEVRDFDKVPEGIGSALHEAKHILLISVSALKCLTDFGSENFQKMEVCWVEKCSNLEILLPVNKEKNLGTMVDGNKDVCETGKSGAEITSASDSGSISSKMFPSCTFGNLKRLHLEHCPTLFHIGCSSEQVPNLEVLQIKHCESLKTLFQEESAELSRLQNLHLWGLPELNNISCKIPSISTLDIGECAQIEQIVISSRDFEKFKILRIRSCDKLKSISCHPELLFRESPIWYLLDLPELDSVPHNPEVAVDKKHVRGCPKLPKNLHEDKESVTSRKNSTVGILDI